MNAILMMMLTNILLFVVEVIVASIPCDYDVVAYTNVPLLYRVDAHGNPVEMDYSVCTDDIFDIEMFVDHRLNVMGILFGWPRVNKLAFRLPPREIDGKAVALLGLVFSRCRSIDLSSVRMKDEDVIETYELFCRRQKWMLFCPLDTFVFPLDKKVISGVLIERHRGCIRNHDNIFFRD